MKVVIIGGVAGGATAAARIRRLDEKAEIVIIERSGYISYANCGLPYYIGGKIMDRNELTLQTPQSFFERFRIDVRVESEAVAIDRTSKTVRVRERKTGREYSESYDKLILSPGAKPFIPDMPGTDLESVFTLRTVEDTFGIYEYIAKNGVKTAAVIGGGFIGLEMTENLMERGIDTVLLQRSGHVMPPLDGDMAGIVHKYMNRKGVHLRLDTRVTGIEGENGRTKVLTADGRDVPCDIVIMAVGVVLESALAKDAGLKLGMKDSIWTDDHMRTSDEDIYAVGDAVEVTHFVSGERALISLAGPANKQGRIAADNICGMERTFKGSQGSSVLKLFDMTIAATGLNEKLADAAGIDHDKAILSGMSHAAYYPGAAPMTMKVLFEKKTARIIGAQIVGTEGADKRIDVLAAAIRTGATAEDLTELDLAYAPPYSSAKDPVNMAGYMIENLTEGIVEQVHWDDVEKVAEKKRSEGSGAAERAADGEDMQDVPLILDVRTDFEFAHSHIEGALHIPLDDLRDRMEELPGGRELYVYCHSGLRSYLACRILSQNGYRCFNVAGGYGFYMQSR